MNDQLGTIMRKAFREVAAQARRTDGSPLRVAAYELGIERVRGGRDDARLHQLTEQKPATAGQRRAGAAPPRHAASAASRAALRRNPPCRRN